MDFDSERIAKLILTKENTGKFIYFSIYDQVTKNLKFQKISKDQTLLNTFTN